MPFDDHQPSDPTLPDRAALAERRLWVRYPADRRAHLHGGDLGRTVRWQTRVRDISQGGLQLIFNLPVPVGTLLWVELPDVDGRHTLPLRVVRCASQPEYGWTLGCRFVNPLTDEQLAAALADI